MHRLAAALLLIPALQAQLTTDIFSKAPPAVDEALRARIRQFFQLHVDGKFRQAEQLVADESKDFFYSANKPKYLSFEISRIDYSENFTKAKATVVCQMYVMVPGFAGKPLPVPTPSLWKLVNGEWYWYVDQQALNKTPFGEMKAAQGSTPNPNATLPALPSEQEALKMIDRVKADKDTLRLDPNAPSSGQVTVSNQLPGKVTLAVSGPKVEGLEVQLPGAIESNQKGTVTFRYKPGKTKPSAPVTQVLRIEETGQAIPVRITWAK